MSTNPLEMLETTSRTVKRAQYEALEFTLAPNGVRVRNNSHENADEHEYLIDVADGIPTSCTCPADANYSGACKHRVAVAIRRPILDAATQQQLVADGGSVDRRSALVPDEGDDADEDTRDCDCADLASDFPCWECYHSGRRDLPDD